MAPDIRRGPSHVRRLRERHTHARRHGDWLHRGHVVCHRETAGLPKPDGTEEGKKIAFPKRTSVLRPSTRSCNRFLFVETLPRRLLSPLVRNRRHHRSRPDSQLHWTHTQSSSGEHSLSRYDGNSPGCVPSWPLVGSHRRPPLEFCGELVTVPGDRSGRGDFPLVPGEYDRRLLLGLDGPASRLSKVSPHRTQFRPVPCLVPLYLWRRQRDRHESAGNLYPGGTQ